MLESMGLQRVGHDLATEQKPKSKKGWVRRERGNKKTPNSGVMYL